MYPDIIEQLIDHLSKLPGVGEKTAQRYIFEIIDWNESQIKKLGDLILNLPNSIHYCSECGNFSELDRCNICIDQERNKELICVVATIRDLIAIEKTNLYNGKYHVLNGLISINNGVYPEDLKIDQFIERCLKNNVKEVIMALNSTIDGETTTLYLSKKLEEKNINITRLANGLPLGSNIEYADTLTLSKAFEDRKKI